MSDFFTKKQRKWWCECCRIFVEYTKMMIDQHKRSKNHQKNLNQTLIYENRKAKAQKKMGINTMESTNDSGNMDRNNNKESTSTKFDQKLYLSRLGTPNQIQLNMNNQGDNNNRNNYNKGILSDKHSYTMSNNLLEEIKLEKMQEEFASKNPGKFIGKKKAREWGIFIDPETNSKFYHNFKKRESQWERPDDYDGPEEIENDNSNENEENSENKKRLQEGVIGKWEVVDPKESFYEKYKAKEPVQQNFYSEEEFLRRENLISEENEDDYKNPYEDSESEEEAGISTINNNLTIDDYIIDKKKEGMFDKISNDDIIQINNKLKKNDFDFKFSTNKVYGNEEKNLNKINEISENTPAVEIEFKPKKIQNKIKSISVFNEL